jgi:type IV pilus assembly protein PilV
VALIRNERGETLLAVMVALVLLTIGLLTLARTQTTQMTASRTVLRRSAALAVARSYLEELRSRDPMILVSEGPVTLDDRGEITAGGPFTGLTEVTAVTANLLRVRVLVRPTGSTRQPVELVTLVYRGTP